MAFFVFGEVTWDGEEGWSGKTLRTFLKRLNAVAVVVVPSDQDACRDWRLKDQVTEAGIGGVRSSTLSRSRASNTLTNRVEHLTGARLV